MTAASTSRQLGSVSLDISEIQVECSSWNVGLPHGRPSRPAGLIRLRGTYPGGSRGERDARFIRWKVFEFCDLLRPLALVVDMRELDYQWGDDLRIEPPTGVPLLVVIDEPQRKAFSYPVGEEALRTDFDAAMDEAEGLVRTIAMAKQAPLKVYVWSEVWMDTGLHPDVVFVRQDPEGKIDVLTPDRAARIIWSFDDEAAANAYLGRQGYARVAGRHIDEVTAAPP